MIGNLDLYNAAAARMRPVDIIAVRGGTSDPVGHPIEVVSAIIEKVGESKGKPGYSHIAIVRQPLLAGRDVQIIESTIEAGANGVQTHALGATLAGYEPGSHADWYPLSAKSRARVDLGAFYAWCGRNDGVTRYSIQELFQFMFLPDWVRDHEVPQDAEVCSVAAGAALKAAMVCPDILPWEQKPTDIVALEWGDESIFDIPVAIF
jgi:hypothetical protein